MHDWLPAWREFGPGPITEQRSSLVIMSTPCYSGPDMFFFSNFTRLVTNDII